MPLDQQRQSGCCAHLQLELFSVQAESTENRALPARGASEYAACIPASMNIFKQIEDADGDKALVLAKSVSEQMASPDSGMRAVGDSGVFLSEKGEALPMATQAACAYAFALLLAAPEHKQTTVGLSNGRNSCSTSRGSSLIDLVRSVMEPVVSSATHVVMQISLVIMFVTLGQ